MRLIVEKVLRDRPDLGNTYPVPEQPAATQEEKLEERRQVATQDLLYTVLELLQSRGIVKRAMMTLHAVDRLMYWESRLVADAYRKRRGKIGQVRVFVTMPQGVTDPMAPAWVKIQWSLTLGGVWYTMSVKVKDPLQIEGKTGAMSVVPAIAAAQRTLDGTVSLSSVNRMHKKEKKRNVVDRVVLQGLRRM